MKIILEEMIYNNYVLGVDIDTLYLELLEETLQSRGKNLSLSAEDEIYFIDSDWLNYLNFIKLRKSVLWRFLVS